MTTQGMQRAERAIRLGVRLVVSTYSSAFHIEVTPQGRPIPDHEADDVGVACSRSGISHDFRPRPAQRSSVKSVDTALAVR